jgi:hypothetical protein
MKLQTMVELQTKNDEKLWNDIPSCLRCKMNLSFWKKKKAMYENKSLTLIGSFFHLLVLELCCEHPQNQYFDITLIFKLGFEK